MCNFLCQTFDFVFKHCNVGWMVRNNNILGFLLNPFRTELYLLLLIFSCVVINVCQHSVLCWFRCRFICSFLAYFLYLAACSTHSVLKGFILQTVRPVRFISNKIENRASLYHNFVEKRICSVPYFTHGKPAIWAVSRNK